VARLTPSGMGKLKAAWPVHLESARATLFDLLDPTSVRVVPHAMSIVAAHLEDGPLMAR
jgi:hypothetical protein